MTERSVILLEEPSPYGTVNAVVEDDGRSVYLYLDRPAHTQSVWRACWVRNLQPAPSGPDPKAAETGCAPLLPISACRYPAGLPRPKPEDLSLVWFPEGDSVALLERGEVTAIIPPWVGLDHCPGYARDCIEPTPVCWPLGSKTRNKTLERLREAQGFWSEWESHDPWPRLQRALLDSVEAALGAPHSAYWAMDGGHFPPRFITRTDLPAATVLATGGVSVRPQPEVIKHYQDIAAVRRIELGLALDPALLSGLDLKGLLDAMAATSGVPWGGHELWLATGHTVPMQGLPVGPSGTPFVGCLVHAAPPGAPTLSFERYRGDPINLLWLIPITASERAMAMEAGTEALLTRLVEAGVDFCHRDRKPVV